MKEIHEMFKRRDEGKCPFCGQIPQLEDFKNELSLKEFKISGLCQKCQDEFYGKGDA